MKIEKTTAADWLHEEMTDIPARITAIEETDGTYGPGLKLVMYDAESGDDIWAFCGQKMTARTKLGKWATSLFGELPDTLDTDDLIGLGVNVIFERYTNDAGDLKEKVIMLKPRELTAEEDAEALLAAQLQSQEAPF